jgi:nucleolar protein 12
MLQVLSVDKQIDSLFNVIPPKNNTEMEINHETLQQIQILHKPIQQVAEPKVQPHPSRRQLKNELIGKNSRTIFIGNLPTSIISSTNTIKQLFKRYGEIESIRYRSIAFDSKLPRKIAFSKKMLHTNRDTLTCYIVFKQDQKKGDGLTVAKESLEMNGHVFLDHVLQVDIAEKSVNNTDSSKSVFIGNLPFDASIQTLHDFFAPCGDIAHTRVVRDRNTNIGKGFAYVQFKSSVAVEIAVKMNGALFMNRKIRVQRSVEKLANKLGNEKMVQGAKSTVKTEIESKPDGKIVKKARHVERPARGFFHL